MSVKKASPADLSAALDPKHLLPAETEEELRGSVIKKMEAPPQAEDVKKSAMKERGYTFSFSFTGAGGRVYAGTFTNRVPDVRTRMQIGVLRAQLGGGMPVESLDGLTRELNQIVAHLTFSLETRPSWANELRNLEETEVLYKLYEEVMAHEATFLGRG